jgi:lipid-binding SYLF domain-containing protein
MDHKSRFTSILHVLVFLILACTPLLAFAGSPDEDRAKIRKQSQEVLQKLYEAQPRAEQAIAKSKGYATFSKWGLTLGPLGGGIGRGLAVQKPSGAETFMRYVEGSAGVGMGIKKYALIFVFETEEARSNFVNNGWEASTQSTLAIKRGNLGTALEGATSVSPGVWIYQVTEKGLSADFGLKGTKYYKDNTLN